MSAKHVAYWSKVMEIDAVGDAVRFLGRILMIAIFPGSGWMKLTNWSMTQGYMESVGVPGVMLPLVVLTELGGSFLILIGYQTRIAAFLLAGFCVVTAIAMHFQLDDPMQSMNFFKNFAMCGGFLLMIAAGPGRWSVDGRLGR